MGASTVAGTPAICAIAVMGKASAPGRTKTRLVPPLSAEEAARLNTAFLKDIAGNVLQAQREADIAPYIAFGPRGAEPFFRGHLPAQVALIECSLPNFGDCLFHAITLLLNAGHESACVLNSDSPTLPTAYLVEAARALALPGDRLVIGPCTDGGYYLLGVKHPHRHLFNEIDWSTSRVYEQTVARARELDLPVTVLDFWYDVDEAEALDKLAHDVMRAKTTEGVQQGIYPADHTRVLLEDLVHSENLNCLSASLRSSLRAVR